MASLSLLRVSIMVVLAVYVAWHICCCAWLLNGGGSPQCVRILTFRSWYVRKAALPWHVPSDAATTTSSLGMLSTERMSLCDVKTRRQWHTRIGNHTSRSSSVSKVMLALWGPRLDHAVVGVAEVRQKMEALQVYSRHFLSVILLEPRTISVGYLQAAYDQRTTNQLLAQAPASFFCQRSYPGSAEQYGCMAELLQLVLTWRKRCSGSAIGVLFAHADMWLSPGVLSLPFSATGPMMLQTSWKQYLGKSDFETVLRCANLTRVQAEDGFILGTRLSTDRRRHRVRLTTNSTYVPTPSGFWNWGDGSGTISARSAVAGWGADWHQLSHSTLSVGWADAYFVPTRGMEDMAKIFETFALHGMPNEAAVPTAIFLACRKHALSVTTMSCLGSCCTMSFNSTQESSPGSFGHIHAATSGMWQNPPTVSD